MRRVVSSAVIAGALTALLSSCGTTTTVAQTGVSWAPKPQQSLGFSVVASTVVNNGDPQLALHTAHGDVTFWGGVNLGTTIPGHNPGELAVPRATYRKWLPQMASMGIRFIRVYTIMTPAFYEELLAYNTAHATAPLYLVQGVYLPDESYTDGGTLLDAPGDQAFSDEIADASEAVHGTLYRAQLRGLAWGTWRADVSPWVAAWIVGAELDPLGVQRTDSMTATPRFLGTYFTSSLDSTPTERWLARHMDELATAESTHGTSAPIAFANWPTDDPLVHPEEPLRDEDLVSLDANHVLPTDAWPAGTFASYHAYPYYPDFMRYEPALQQPLASGKTDPYLAYITALKAHHAASGMPTMITEFGVPAALGSAHSGTLGRGQGAHTEEQAMAMDAQMMRGIKTQGLSGAFLFIWADEWFKFTWNTRPRTFAADAERRSLWHDPLTNEQWFGVIAQDPVAAGWSTPYESPDGPLRSVSTQHDAAYVYIEVKFHQDRTKPLTLGFDVVPGGRTLPTEASGVGVYDVAVIINPKSSAANAFVVSAADPIQLDGLDPASLPKESYPGWNLQRLTTNRAYAATATLAAHPAEFLEVGRLIRGSWDVKAKAYNSKSTWWLDRDLLEVRIPWSMLLMSDPSSKTAYVPEAGAAKAVPVSAIKFSMQVDGRTMRMASIRWDAWNQARAKERTKKGAAVLAKAWRAVSQN